MLACYSPWLNAGYVNLEYPFHLAARALSGDPTPGLMDAYFDKQANPLGYSLVLSLIYRLVGTTSTPWIARLPSMASAALLLASAWYWYRRDGRQGRVSFAWWSALIISHPMIAAFATHGTADLLPAGLVVAALVSAARPGVPSWRGPAIATVLLAVATVMKYTSAFFGVVLLLAWISALRTAAMKHRVWWAAIGATGIAASIVATHAWWMWERYGVWIFSGTAKHLPDPTDLSGWFGGLVGYGIFTGLFLGPTPAATSVRGMKQISVALVLAGLVSIGYLRLRPEGELDFGALVPLATLFGWSLLVIGAVLVSMCIVGLWAQRVLIKDSPRALLLWGATPALVVIAAARPAQRYLISILPVLLIVLIGEIRGPYRRMMMLATVMGFALVSMLGLSYLRAQGDASEATAQWLRGRDLLASSDPSAICPHACHHWVGTETKPTTARVSAIGRGDVVPASALHVEEMRVLGWLVRTYAVVPISAVDG
jgi:hypothetical protein